MRILRDLLLLTPNVLLVFTFVAWLVAIFELIKKRPAPNRFWLTLVITTLLLPLMGRALPARYLAAYLPRLIFHSPMLYVNLVLAILPALFAVVGWLGRARLPGDAGRDSPLWTMKLIEFLPTTRAKLKTVQITRSDRRGHPN